MSGSVAAILTPILLLIAFVFLAIRLRFFAKRKMDGRAPFITGALLVFLGAVWETVTINPGYTLWFFESVYAWFDLIQWLLYIIGGLLLLIGLSLYSDFWQTKGAELNMRDQKLSLLEGLQRDAREPYQLLELLNISIKDILAELPECAGAIFLLNKKRRQLVLTASMALTKQETSSLEYYPFSRNAISQAVDMGEPFITGRFVLFDLSGSAIESRFQSSLVLPLISGMEKIGAIVLLAEPSQFFSRTEIRYLSPVAEWLAEKIRSARLLRELALTRDDLKMESDRQTDISVRLLSTAEAFTAADSVASFCHALVGLLGSTSVHLVGMVNGVLDFHGGSEPLPDATENYRTALIGALDRNKPLVINQEAITDDGKSYIAQSTLLYPIRSKGRQDALLFRRESGPFKVSEDDLKMVEVFARLGGVVLRQSDNVRLNITRRKGFTRILQLLRFDGGIPAKVDTAILIDNLMDILPARSAVISFTRQDDNSFKTSIGGGVEKGDLSAFHIMPGEGVVGQTVQTKEPLFIFGRNNVSRAVDEFGMVNRDTFYRILGERGLPVFLVACPLLNLDRPDGVVVVLIHDINENERGEWERLLTLAAGLYSIRLTLADLHRTQTPSLPEEFDVGTLGGIVSKLNNHLSAVIGNAELAASQQDLTGETKSHFESIIDEAQLAADYIRRSLGTNKGVTAVRNEETHPASDLNAILRKFLNQTHISENLYMLSGKPREVDLRFHPVVNIGCSDEILRSLIRDAISRFATLITNDQVMTISTYRFGDHIYLDVSRHHKAMPAVEGVAGLGQYRMAKDAARLRPDDTFLALVIGEPVLYCSDESVHQPSFFSFKFPIRKQVSAVEPTAGGNIRILAIDDQIVILELVTAMCQSLGYAVRTATSGEEGLKLAGESDFDIILVDLSMPGISGLDVARRMKMLDPDVPIVLVTGWEVT
ncbi:MAG: response regulator, partial [candidate division Zixibacteria bacterium]|nr:response regulator [candidate division Zixibacteria bacterium]